MIIYWLMSNIPQMWLSKKNRYRRDLCWCTIICIYWCDGIISIKLYRQANQHFTIREQHNVLSLVSQKAMTDVSTQTIELCRWFRRDRYKCIYQCSSNKSAISMSKRSLKLSWESPPCSLGLAEQDLKEEHMKCRGGEVNCSQLGRCFNTTQTQFNV